MPSPATHGRKPHCNVTSLPGSKSGPSPRRGDGRSLQKGETAEDTQWVWGWNCTNNPYRGALLDLAAGSRVSGRWVQSRRPLGPRGPRPSLILTPAVPTASQWTFHQCGSAPNHCLPATGTLYISQRDDPDQTPEPAHRWLCITPCQLRRMRQQRAPGPEALCHHREAQA